MTAEIFNIQRFCVNDGPGIRSTVFSRDVICVAPGVTIPDPTEGYGIFIENMLNQMGDLAG